MRVYIYIYRDIYVYIYIYIQYIPCYPLSPRVPPLGQPYRILASPCSRQPMPLLRLSMCWGSECCSEFERPSADKQLGVPPTLSSTSKTCYNAARLYGML